MIDDHRLYDLCGGETGPPTRADAEASDDPHHTGDADVAHEGQADLQGAPESQTPTPQRQRRLQRW